MRRISSFVRPGLIAAAALALAGCPPSDAADMFRFEIGHEWEYFLVEGGDNDEVWNLQVLDAEENPDSGRGDVYMRLTRTFPDPSLPGQTQTFDQRRFNLRREQDLTGSAAVEIGWTYRWVNQDEGEREEFFVMTPENRRDWSASWDYSISGAAGGSDFDYDVAGAWREQDDPIQTSFGTWVNTSNNPYTVVDYQRTVTITSEVAGQNDELVQTQEHFETWVRGFGLVRYRIIASDGDASEGVLRTTNAAESPSEG